MKTYESLKLEIIQFEAPDVITSSVCVCDKVYCVSLDGTFHYNECRFTGVHKCGKD